jgi:fatty acid desaturase
MKNKQFIKDIRADIGKLNFPKTPMRLLWMIVFVVFLSLSFYGLTINNIFISVCCSLLIGYTFAAMAFLFHDLRHGGIISNQKVINICSQLLIWPSLVSSRFWDFWHNQLHHRHHLMENRMLKEYPTDSFVKGTFLQKLVQKISPPQSGISGFLYLFFWYVPFIVLVQSMLLFQTDRFRALKRSEVLVDVALNIVFWAAWIALIGVQNILWAVVIPLFVMSYILSSYVVTNHHPALVGVGEEKILNSCSVTVNPVIQFFHLEFGLHTEHHLFPDISPQHLPRIREKLLQNYSAQYCSHSKTEALKKIYFSS